MKDDNIKYKVAEILIDKSGDYSLNYFGYHPGQGCEDLGYGSVEGTGSLENTLKFLQEQLSRVEKAYIKLLKEKE